jgi:membrane protease YdiL (CAAX protease family)
MPDWATFAGFVGIVLVALIGLAHASTGVVRDATDREDRFPSRLSERVVGSPDRSPPTATVLANVVLSQGVFAALLVIGAWYAAIPPAALGVDALSLRAAGAGIGLGLALYALNEVGTRIGLGGSEALRRLMAPDSTVGWALLLCVVLPLVAGFEELLFRGILVGAFAAGFGLSPWPLAVLSSVAFALGHGAQGKTGIAVTGVFGFVLAAAFVITGSLLTVVVAHYLVNALEFLVNETPAGRSRARSGR